MKTHLKPSEPKHQRAVIIGGSLGGLFTGNLLRQIGWEVDIYERSSQDLDSRGGGIVLQPEVTQAIHQIGYNLSPRELGVESQNRVVYRPDGGVESRGLAPQIQTSWSLIYGTLKRAFGDAHYHQGKMLDSLQTDENEVTATFSDGSEASGHLLVGSDGNGSTVRRLLWPEAHTDYAGYLAWRGLVAEHDIPREAQELIGDFAFAGNHQSHMLGYLVPGDGNDLRKGYRIYNWVWYRTAGEQQLQKIMTDKNGKQRGFGMPEGLLAERWKQHVYAEASTLLPPNFRAMVQATREPFAQAIRDSRVDRMVKGKVVLLGDAAFIPRPHTAASTSKAAANALTLADALQRYPSDLPSALKEWEQAQLSLGQALYNHGRRIGNQLMFP